jgi:hypothetical protein
MWEGRPLGPNALADLAEDRAFHERCARELQAHEWAVPQPRGVTQGDFDHALKYIGEAIGKELKKLRDRIVALEQGQLKMGGTWKAGERYAENTLVSFQGGLWISRADTEARPGSGSPAWRLCVKRGDAK